MFEKWSKKKKICVGIPLCFLLVLLGTTVYAQTIFQVGGSTEILGYLTGNVGDTIDFSATATSTKDLDEDTSDGDFTYLFCQAALKAPNGTIVYQKDPYQIHTTTCTESKSWLVDQVGEWKFCTAISWASGVWNSTSLSWDIVSSGIDVTECQTADITYPVPDLVALMGLINNIFQNWLSSL